MRFINSIKYMALCLLLFLMAISYHPYFFGDINAEVEAGNRVLSLPIIILFAALTVLSLLIPKSVRSSLFRTSAISIVLVGVLALLLLSVFGNATMISDIKALSLVLASILIGKSMKLSERKLLILITVFGLTALFSGLMQIYQNIGGFIIADQYLANSKNSLGTILATAVIAFIYAASRSKRLSKFFYYSLAVLGGVIVLTIRARASFLAIGLVVIAIFIRQIRSRGIIWTISILAISVLALFILPESVFNYVLSSITAGSQGTDITSGRMWAYQEALSIIGRNPFLGNIIEQQEIPWVHNYLLLKLSSYGLLFSWPLVFYYFYLLVFCIKGLMRTNRHDNGLPVFFQGYSLLLILFVISILEPTFPFAPGTAVAFNFIMLGVADSNTMSQ